MQEILSQVQNKWKMNEYSLVDSLPLCEDTHPESFKSFSALQASPPGDAQLTMKRKCGGGGKQW